MPLLPPTIRFIAICLTKTVLVIPAIAQNSGEPTDSKQSAFPILPVATEDIDKAVASGEYILFSRARLHELRASNTQTLPGDKPHTRAITRAEYSATLMGNSLKNGTARFELESSQPQLSLIPGHTNLRKLAFSSEGKEVLSAAMPDGRLSLLEAPTSPQLQASWEADGILTPDGVQFDLRLPPAAVTEVRLTTASNIHVTSTNAIVQSEIADEQRRWIMFPRSSHNISFVCAQNDNTSGSGQIDALSLDTTFSITQHSAFAEWKLVTPPELANTTFALTISDDCQITNVLDQTGKRISWKLTEEPDRQLVISRLQAGRTLSIHGTTKSLQDGSLTLPLLSVTSQTEANGSIVSIPLRSTGIRLVVPQNLAVRKLILDGLYQEEVSLNSADEQVIELRRFSTEASVSIMVEPATATVHQRLLIHRPPENLGMVTVYAELQPRSDQVYKVIWSLSGSWRATNVYDMRSGLPVYSGSHRSADGKTDVLQIELPAAATSSQPALLRIEFRSTQAITPQTHSLPVLVNSGYRPITTWILSSVSSPLPKVLDVENIPNIKEGILTEFEWLIDVGNIPNVKEEIRDEFKWLIDDLSQPEGLQLVKTSRALIATRLPSPQETAIARATLNYQLQLSRTHVTEDIALQLSAIEQLPASMTMLFPEDIEVQVDPTTSTGQITPTGRITDNHWREWQLTLSPVVPTKSTYEVNLRVTRPIAAATFAALPRLPDVPEVILTSRNITADNIGFTKAALVSKPTDNSGSDSWLLESGIPVVMQRVTSRLQLKFTQTNVADRFLGIRGTTWHSLSSDSNESICRCMADLVVSRTGLIESLEVNWTDAHDIQVFVDNQPISCPVTNNTTHIFLPANQPITNVRILWKSSASPAGWFSQSSILKLPNFKSVDSLNLSHYSQLPTGTYSPSGKSSELFAAMPEYASTQSPPLVSTNASVRDFCVRWELANETGAVSQPTLAVNGQIPIPIRSLRWLVGSALLAFWFAIVARSYLLTFRLRSIVAILFIGSIIANYGNAQISCLLLGWNSGLALVLVHRRFWLPVAHLWNRRTPTRDQQTTSTASVAASAVAAILLTGQAPASSNTPPILIKKETQATTPFVFVRKDLVPTNASPVISDVRVLDVVAQVRVEQEGGTDIAITATIARRRTEHELAFNIPVASSTLKEGCTLDESKVAPVRGPDGHPQITLPASRISTPNINDSLQKWAQHRISYTLRSKVTPIAQRFSIQVPLPFSTSCQLTLETANDPILTARLAGLSNGLAVAESPGTLKFPTQYNRGPLDIEFETRRSRILVTESECQLTVTYRPETPEARTRIICRYQLTSDKAGPMEVSLASIPGFQATDIRNGDMIQLQSTEANGRLIVRATQQRLETFQVTWTASKSHPYVSKTIPAAALTPPDNCKSTRTLLAVRATDPFEVRSATINGNFLSRVTIGKREQTALQIAPTEDVYEVDSPFGDIQLQLQLQNTLRKARVTQKVVVGIEELNWSCRCELNVTGPPTFRQRIRIPTELLIDTVVVTAGGANRLRSWSARDGLLLVSFREGTRGAYELNFSGTMQLPADGRCELKPVELESTVVQEPSLLLSSANNATVRLEQTGGLDLSNPIAEPGFTFSNPVSLTFINPDIPLTLSVRTQNHTSARMVVVTHNQTQDLRADAVIHIQAGDQSWNGRIRMPNNLLASSIDWKTGESTRPLPVERDELSLDRLAPRESGVLVLQDIHVLSDGVAQRIPLPVLEPTVAVERLQIYGQLQETSTATQTRIPWMLSTLESARPPALLPGLIDRGQTEKQYDAQNNSIPIAEMQLERSLPTRVRQTTKTITISHLYRTRNMLSGRTDILIDFGTADTAQCVVPSHLSITDCRLDNRPLPQTNDPNVISIQREAAVQRLTIDWIASQPTLGYLPGLFKLVVPSVDATIRNQFVCIHSPHNHSWSVADSLITTSSAQLTEFISNAFPAPQTSQAENYSETGQQTVELFREDNQSAGEQSSGIFEVPEIRTAAIRWRQNFPWPHWIPMLVLCAVCVVISGRRIVQQRPQPATASSNHESSDHAPAPVVIDHTDSAPSLPGQVTQTDSSPS